MDHHRFAQEAVVCRCAHAPQVGGQISMVPSSPTVTLPMSPRWTVACPTPRASPRSGSNGRRPEAASSALQLPFSLQVHRVQARAVFRKESCRVSFPPSPGEEDHLLSAWLPLVGLSRTVVWCASPRPLAPPRQPE